jgi:DNA-directed RNA polymerase subunit RPC12/RpoP
MKCSVCGSERLRLSHLRASDLPRLLSLSYPVRCAACNERMFVSSFAAFGIHRRARARKRAAREIRHTAPHSKENGA